MRTRVVRLRHADGDVACAWFDGNTGETFIFGKQPEDLTTEVEADDFAPINSCRFMARGSVLKTNQFREETITTTSPWETSGNLKWCRFTIQEDNTLGFCLDTMNTNHRMIGPHRLILQPNETQTLNIVGYLCTAEGNILINGEAVSDREIITLSGASISITAGPNGAQVGAIEVEHL